MRRVVISVTMAVAGCGLPAAPAQATFHLNMVNEVMTSAAGGGTGVQFVEFRDPGGSEELFTPVFAPYKLIVYDAQGRELGEQTLSPSGLRGAAASDREYLVSTAAADATFGVKGDERLTVSLPLTAGQVCFAGNEPPPKPVDCMTYGTIAKAVATNSSGTGTSHGPVPPAGESDQLQGDGTVVAAPPTPKAPNRSGSPPPRAGKPTESQLVFSGVGRGRAKLAFHVAAGKGAPGLAKVTVVLPHGLRFSSAALAHGLQVAGARVRSRALRHGALVIALSAPARAASVVVSHGAIAVGKRLAVKVRRHEVRRLKVVVTVIDGSGRLTAFGAEVRVG